MLEGERRRSYRFEILLASFAGLLLEVSYTRVISFKVFYYYTYLVIGLALLGIGCGGVIVAISRRVRDSSTEAVLRCSFLLGGASVLVGYAVVVGLPIDTLGIWEYDASSSIDNLASLVGICVAIFASFVSIGVIVATLFARRADEIGPLYFADLVGAGLACALVVVLIGSIGPPSTILLAGLLLALAGVRLTPRTRPGWLAGGAVLSVLLLVATVAPSVLPLERTDTTKIDLAATPPIYSKWSPIFRVDVAPVGDDFLLLSHDGLPGSAIYRFDGDVSSLDRYETAAQLLPFAVGGDPPRKELIIGAAGGNEVLASLFFRARHIDAVELNNVTHDLVTNKYADFAGRIAEHPRVNYLHGDGRTFLARSDDAYDLIWYPAPDSYAASNAATAGAFVLSESYLYTRESIEESFEHLSSDGLIVTQFGEVDFEVKPNRTTRYVTTVRAALRERGIDDPARHVLVATTPAALIGTLSTILVKPTPFTDAEVDRFVSALDDIERSTLRYAPGADYGKSLVSQAITTPTSALDDLYASYRFDVSPIDDDAPFFWHFTAFNDVISTFTHAIDRSDPEDTIGERVLLLLVAVAVVLAAIFLLLPFVKLREIWRALPRKGTSAVYFSALGLGFLFFEITLIQRLVLFLGYPTYSLTVTLLSILVFTGVGALLTERYKDRVERAIPILLAVITALTVFYLFALTPLTEGVLGAPLAVRVLLAFFVLAPLGICLGAFMPLGIGAVARLAPEHTREYVAWGWAVNGFASVIGSVLTTILAMTFGFNAVLVIALAVYMVALRALRSLLKTPTPAS
ncbi:MAG: hypothetical protein FJW86_08330 [Actinobacteria bacterium]|nr:hypothetical protein [Actinomycetota bacterium]